MQSEFSKHHELRFFQEVLSYVDEFQLNKLDLALSNKKHTTKNAIRFSYQKKTPRKTKNKARPPECLDGWFEDEFPSFLLGSFRPIFQGQTCCFFVYWEAHNSHTQLQASNLSISRGLFFGGSPKKSDTKKT